MINNKKSIKQKSGQKPPPNPMFAERFDGTVECPWCGSMNSKLSSAFGSTVSEMIFTCGDCGDTFGWMKWQQERDHRDPKIKSEKNESN